MKLKLSKPVSLLMFVMNGGICQCPASGITLCEYDPEGGSMQDKNEPALSFSETAKKIAQESRDEESQFDPVPSKMLKVDVPSDGDKKDDLSVDELCESNAKITMLAEKICSVDFHEEDTVEFVSREIREFEEYYNSKLKTTQAFMKKNQDLIDCWCLIVYVTNIGESYKFFPSFFFEITNSPMTKENAKDMLKESEGEIACNFRESGGFDEFL